MEEKKDQIKENNNDSQTPEKTDSQTVASNVEAQVIGEIATEKQKGVFGVIVFFFILIGFTIGLPYLSDYINKKNVLVDEKTTNDENSKENINNEEVKEQVYYEIDNNTVFTIDNLGFNNFSKENSDDFYLNVTLTNKDNKEFSFSANYYLELYNNDKTLLERVKLINSKNLASNESVDLKLSINENTFNNASLLTVVQKSTDDYPEVNLVNTEDDYKILSCNNTNENIVYYFTDNKLIKISDAYNYSNTDASTYNNNLKIYQDQTAKYNNFEGVTSSIADTSYSFTINTQIDLDKANIEQLESYYYFKKDTDPKIVKFEMEAQRFTCK